MTADATRDNRIGKDEYCARECRHCAQPQIAFVRHAKSDDPWRCTGCGNPERDIDAVPATPIAALVVEDLHTLAAVSAVHEKPGEGNGNGSGAAPIPPPRCPACGAIGRSRCFDDSGCDRARSGRACARCGSAGYLKRSLSGVWVCRHRMGCRRRELNAGAADLRAHLQRIADAITRAGAQAGHPARDGGVDLSRVEMPASAWDEVLRAMEGDGG